MCVKAEKRRAGFNEQNLRSWLEDKNLEMRDALDVGDQNRQSWAVAQNRVQKWLRCGRGLQSWRHVHVDLLEIRKMQPRTFV